MYTRCPQCQTTFEVTQAQLDERDGIVRCGECNLVFRGNQNLVADEVEQAAPGHQPIKFKAAHSETMDEEDLAETLRILTGRAGGQRLHPLLWFVGCLLTLTLLLGQLTYINRNQWSQLPEWGAHVTRFCEIAGCIIDTKKDIGLIELTDTRVVPHGKYENVLKVQATLINRADFRQPYPRLEINLTDRRGEVVARRIFDPEKYLDNIKVDNEGMPKNVAVKVRLELLNPNMKAEGYEIRLVAAT